MTAEEVSLIEKGEGGELQKYASKLEGADTSAPDKSSKASSKRKSGVDDEDDAPAAKKAKHTTPKETPSGESEEPEDEDEGDEDS